MNENDSKYLPLLVIRVPRTLLHCYKPVQPFTNSPVNGSPRLYRLGIGKFLSLSCFLFCDVQCFKRTKIRIFSAEDVRTFYANCTCVRVHVYFANFQCCYKYYFVGLLSYECGKFLVSCLFPGVLFELIRLKMGM